MSAQQVEHIKHCLAADVVLKAAVAADKFQLLIHAFYMVAWGDHAQVTLFAFWLRRLVHFQTGFLDWPQRIGAKGADELLPGIGLFQFG